MPHSLQGTNASDEGSEFLLVRIVVHLTVNCDDLTPRRFSLTAPSMPRCLKSVHGQPFVLDINNLRVNPVHRLLIGWHIHRRTLLRKTSVWTSPNLIVFPPTTYTSSREVSRSIRSIKRNAHACMTVAPPLDATAPEDPQGTIPLPYSFEFSKVVPTQYAGGTVKIADTRTFPISKTISVAEITVEPGAMRYVYPHK